MRHFSNKKITLTYAWWKKDHGVCGHIYECFEYYLYLDYYYKGNVEILFTEIWINKESLLELLDKYNYTDLEKQSIINNSIFINKPKMLILNNLFLVDGNLEFLRNNKICLDVKNIISFGCDKNGLDESVQDIYKTFLELGTFNKFINLVDKRLEFKEVTHDNILYLDYVKKLDLQSLKTIQYKYNHDRYLLYLTSQCRKVSNEYLKNIINKYSTKDSEFIILTDNKEIYQDLNQDNIKFINPPLKNIFEEFNKYIYTMIPRRWDCSSRFIIECKYFNKEILLELDKEYLKDDLGLKYRIEDSKNHLKLNLTKDDNLIDLIKGLI